MAAHSHAYAVGLALLLVPARIGAAEAGFRAMPEWPPPYEDPIPRCPQRFRRIILTAAAGAGVPVKILDGVLHEESKYNPLAQNTNTNGSVDHGIAQLNGEFLADFQHFDNDGRPFDPYSPEEAIPVAARYLARLYRATGSWFDAVCAYNAGIGRVRRGTVPRRTWQYAERVMEGEWETR